MKFVAPSILMVAVTAACAGIAGCTFGGDSTVAKENDRLRRTLLEQQAATQSLESQLAEARAQVAAANTVAAGNATGLTPDIAALIPRISAVQVERLSGFIPTDNALPATGLIAYVTFTDGRGRFTQGVGTLTANVTYLGKPFTSVTLDPLALRDAYRSGLTGTYYQIDLPLPSPLQRPAKTELTFDITFVDAQTRLTHTATRTVER